MTTAALAAHILAEPAALEALVAPLDDAAMGDLVEHFKSEADRHWFINANRSLEFAALIIRIGRKREDLRHIALGTMARGDALKLLGQLQEAWDELERAGTMFLDTGDEVGWARTRIGLLVICVDLLRVDKALADAQRARSILLRYRKYEKLVVLDSNTATVYNLLGNQQKALGLYKSALATARTLVGSENWVGPIYTNLGNVYNLTGELRKAREYHEQSKLIFAQKGEVAGVALAEFNIAHVYMEGGQYRQSMQLLHRAQELYSKEGLLLDATDVSRDIIECYLQLNRYADARDLARDILPVYHSNNAAFAQGITLLHLASAEAGLRNIVAADEALHLAEPIFTSLRAENWLATVHLRKGQIALQVGDSTHAEQEIMLAIAGFATDGQQVKLADALLIRGQAQLAFNNLNAACRLGLAALSIALHSNVPRLRYRAHLLLGRVAQARGDIAHAQRRYLAAIATIERVQLGLTITLRTGFLEDKSEALHALINLHLSLGGIDKAFETLERVKSHALLGYLANHDSLRWPTNDLQPQILVSELNQLREEHHWFYQLAHDHPRLSDGRCSTITPQQASAEVAAREKRMRAITEQLYLHSGGLGETKPPRLHDVQAALNDNALLVEFYNDGAALWAFTLSNDDIQVQRLPTTPADVDELIEQLQRNISFALDVGQEAPALRRLTTVAQRILQRLYTALLAPIEAQFVGRQRLIVVPYGALHYLPFHLLHNGAGYLIERHEVVVLPAAGMLTRPGPTRPAGARVFAHSWEGRLPLTRSEAQTVQELFDSDVYMEEEARRHALGGTPEQILHIAAHGQHRLDQPDLSFIQLADGQLYTDDLLQHDLSYELVVLSACETGRANVAAGDELIGLGRGFLYAGAGALIASLWRVVDATTVALMAKLYQQLHAGVSKAAALRAAQRALLAEYPGMHPAFWGAFQLVGDARPLTGLADGAQMGADLRTQMNTDLQYHNAEYA